jgi:hypothetical protein
VWRERGPGGEGGSTVLGSCLERDFPAIRRMATRLSCDGADAAAIEVSGKGVNSSIVPVQQPTCPPRSDALEEVQRALLKSVLELRCWVELLGIDAREVIHLEVDVFRVTKDEGLLLVEVEEVPGLREGPVHELRGRVHLLDSRACLCRATCKQVGGAESRPLIVKRDSLSVSDENEVRAMAHRDLPP